MMQHVVALHWNDQTPPNYGDVITPVLQEMVKHIPSIADAAELAAAEAEPQSDLNASSDYRIHLAKVLVRRALENASK